jgi:hypothetical protein
VGHDDEAVVEDHAVRIESSVTSVSWLPSEAVEGMPRLPFDVGLAHYDPPPPDRLDDLARLRHENAVRAANELRAWIEVEDGRIVAHGFDTTVFVNPPRVRAAAVAFRAAELPPVAPDPEVRDEWVRFVHTAGGQIGLPAPRRVLEKPFFRLSSSVTWTTLQLVLHANGEAHASLAGASPFPRHWVYDGEGTLRQKSGTLDFEGWHRETFGERTPWGEADAPAVATDAESELERALSAQVMRSGAATSRRRLEPGDTLVEQGEEGRDMFLLLDGVLDVAVDDEVVAQVGPGAILGERALLEGGVRTATLRAVTACRVVVFSGFALDADALAALADTRRREEN